jgi:hypothetical protein
MGISSLSQREGFTNRDLELMKVKHCQKQHRKIERIEDITLPADIQPNRSFARCNNPERVAM